LSQFLDTFSVGAVLLTEQSRDLCTDPPLLTMIVDSELFDSTVFCHNVTISLKSSLPSSNAVHQLIIKATLSLDDGAVTVSGILFYV